jgi:8-oxo-dGTP pyrophosphatase MutT (NUDIX family)
MRLASVRTRAFTVFLSVFGRLPRQVRRWLVWLGSPHYTVGAICIVRRSDGAFLLVRHSYRGRWGSPGGLSQRGEAPARAAVRETGEEVGLDVEVLGEPAVVVDPRTRRVDVVFLARPSALSSPENARPTSPEIVAAEWFGPGELPELNGDTASAIAALVRAGRLEAELFG